MANKAKKIKWLPRYSSTMEDDNMGRWARVAYAGRFTSMGFFRGKVCQWEIAWVKKIKDHNKFSIHPQYPFKGEYCHDTLEGAMKEVEQTFKHFIRNV